MLRDVVFRVVSSSRLITKNKYLLIKADLFLFRLLHYYFAPELIFSKYFVSNAYNSVKSINYNLCLDSKKTGFLTPCFLVLAEKRVYIKGRAKEIFGKEIQKRLNTKLKTTLTIS